VLTGETGADNAFTVGYPAGQSAVAGLDFDTRLQPAADAVVTIDGLTVTRSSNTVEGVIPGVKLDLLAPTATPATLTVGRDTAPVKEKIQGLVTAYNELQDFLDVMSDPESEDEEYGGILANDSLVRFVRDQARSMVTATSSTPGDTVTALRDIGVTLDREGRLQVDANKLDVSLLARFEEISLAFSADTESASLLDDTPAGIAGDALKRLKSLMATDGPIQSRNTSAGSQLSRAQTDLAELEARMEAVYDRYLKQFAVVDGLVTQLNALRESLAGQFENLSAMYNNK
jgi:flagellar hook-associated protein 2